MISRQIALVSETPDLSSGQLAPIGAAVQRQILNDFAPLWGVQGSVDVFDTFHDIPLGYWPIIIRDDIESNDAGLHKHDENNQPFALVAYTRGWELAVSHEALEMLVDPSGNHLVPGDSIKAGQGRVMYLQEICDPCAGLEFSYLIDGITVCDFCTQRYFDAIPTPGTLYDFRGAISQPLEVLSGGYVSWQLPETGEWWQQVFFGPTKEFVSRGQLTLAAHQSLRAVIDHLPPELGSRKQQCFEAGSAILEAAREIRASLIVARHERGERWRRMIAALAGKLPQPDTDGTAADGASP